MELFTTVGLPEHFITLTPTSDVMTVGSCFAQHVGTLLQQRMGEEHVMVNPFGVLYNPVSIAQSLLMLTEGEKPDGRIFLGQDNVWHSWTHSSLFSAPTEEECRRKVVTSVCEARHRLRSASLLCITFGTTRCYRLLSEGYVVANCHKEPQRCFSEEEYPLDSLISLWRDVLQRLHAFAPEMKVCFTVSPYRYRKYGYHESQIQKSKLLLLADALVSSDDHTAYFPAYEIMLDELRDYRFYAPDMFHPSEQAVGIISSRFEQWTFSPEMKNVAEERYREWRRSLHRQIVKT